MNPFIPTAEIQIGGRLIPRSVVQNNNTALTDAFRAIGELGVGFSGLALNVAPSSAKQPVAANAVQPRWREALFDVVLYTIFDYTNFQNNIAAQTLMTKQALPHFETLTPGGGAYLNEGDLHQADWQDAFYGAANYAQLSQIKNRYDPTHMFYGLTSVGSEYWTVESDGRLCQS